MGKFIDLTGQKFGKLTVIKRVENNKLNRVCWLCLCECGNERIVQSISLTKGKCKSCGCDKGQHNRKYPKGSNKLYKKWLGIKARCYYKNSPRYKDYAGRGIQVCDKWKNDFMSFYNWAINNGYKENLTIDRIDVNGNYEPDNCRWADTKIQANNKRNNHLITYNNETHTLKQWAEIFNIDYKLLHARIVKLKWDTERAFSTPKKTNFLFLTYNNKTQTIQEWSKELNIKENTIFYRLKSGWTDEKILTTPVNPHSKPQKT